MLKEIGVAEAVDAFREKREVIVLGMSEEIEGIMKLDALLLEAFSDPKYHFLVDDGSTKAVEDAVEETVEEEAPLLTKRSTNAEDQPKIVNKKVNPEKAGRSLRSP